MFSYFVCRVGLGCAKVVEFEASDLSGFCSTFEQNRFDKFLLPEIGGEGGRQAG